MNPGRRFARSFGVTWLLALGVFASGCDRVSDSKSSDPPASGLVQSGTGKSAGPVASGDPPPIASASADVLTYHANNARNGLYAAETVLTPKNVDADHFGKIGFLRVRGLVDAQPLYASNVMVQGSPHKVVFAATEHDMAYAFDAETFQPLWQTSLLGAGETTSDNRGCQQVTPEIGVASTPVIDLKSGPHGTIYLVAMSKDAQGRYFQRLHALDLATGAEAPGSPRPITASFPGTGANSKNGRVIFDAKQYEDRAALLLSNGVIYTTWSSHCDHDPYGSWVIGYNAATLQQGAVLSLTPNGTEGAIWMTGDGPAADDAGNIYLLTGNGTFETKLDSRGFPWQADFGNCFVKLAMRDNQLRVADYFTMHNTVDESEQDEDLGSGGIVLLPDLQDGAGKIRHLAMGAGKDQIIYLVDRDSMGKFDPSADRAYQEVASAIGGMEFATPAFFQGTAYFGAYKDTLKAFPFSSGSLSRLPSSHTALAFDYPGTTPSISANGLSNGIVWAVENSIPAALHAYAAGDLSKEIYNSNQAGTRDQFLNNKFIAPVIADGKVLVGTPTGVAVFGLLK